MEERIYTINGIKVKFPYKAYPSQVSMMDKIIKGIDKKQNCLIESPTGSGKSLALLCASLAWQSQACEKEFTESQNEAMFDCKCSCHHGDEEKEAVEEGEKESEKKFKFPLKKAKKGTIDYDDEEEDGSFNITCGDCVCGGIGEQTDQSNKAKETKIFVGTRTHKQIAQIIRELSKTAYKSTRMTVLSSREHTCIHPDVQTNKNEECKSLLEAKSCKYYDRVRKCYTHEQLQNHAIPEPWDIEDIITYGNHTKSCPYFGCRELMSGADLIFCPYNYLIDPHIRRSMQISLQGNVVLLDEAHNIEDFSMQAASLSISSDQLEAAISNLNYFGETNKDQPGYKQLEQMCCSLKFLIERNKNTIPDSNYIYNNNNNYNNNNKKSENVWSGLQLVAMLQLAGLPLDQFPVYEKVFKKILESSEAKDKRVDKKKMKNDKLSTGTMQLLEGVFTVISFMTASDKEHLEDYKIVLTRNMEFSKSHNLHGWQNKKNRAKTWVYYLNFWCFNPAVAFKDMSKGTQSVILTSGTLSPLISFQSELNIPFNIQLETTHVIGSQQVYVTCLSKGPTDQSLLGSYSNAEKFAYQDELGSLLYNVCKTVPQGVLCFLPSYKSLEKFADRWQSTGQMDALGALKDIFLEPRSSDKEVFDDVINSFYQAVHSSLEGRSSKTGALFLAVCRGKVSEGMDFADHYARAVVLVSIPYPNIMDRQINLKKEYNDQRASRGLLGGREWYEVQAFRALNQALGRCIRHRHDWGLIVMADSRFGSNPSKYLPYLSKWVRQRVKWHDNYGAFQTNLEQFIRERLLEDKENNKNNNNKNDDNNEDKNNNDKTFNNKDKYNKNTEMAGKKKRQHKRFKPPKKLKIQPQLTPMTDDVTTPQKHISPSHHIPPTHHISTQHQISTTKSNNHRKINTFNTTKKSKIEYEDDDDDLDDFQPSSSLRFSTPKHKNTSKKFLGSDVIVETAPLIGLVTVVCDDDDVIVNNDDKLAGDTKEGDNKEDEKVETSFGVSRMEIVEGGLLCGDKGGENNLNEVGENNNNNLNNFGENNSNNNNNKNNIKLNQNNVSKSVGCDKPKHLKKTSIFSVVQETEDLLDF